jgi:hypothetical protein
MLMYQKSDIITGWMQTKKKKFSGHVEKYHIAVGWTINI